MDQPLQQTADYRYCYEEGNPDSLVMLDLPIKIPRLIYYSTEDTMFIWLFDRDQPDTYRQLKTKIQSQLNILIIGKNSIQELEKQFEQKRTTANVIIICSPQIYKETAQMKERFKVIKRILVFTLDDTFEADFQVFETDLFINQQQKLIMYINQLKIVSPTAKLLPNFMFLTTKDRMSEVTKSRNISNTLYAMLNQQNSKQTDSLIIDQLKKVIQILEEQNISYKVKSEKSKKFIEQLRNGLSPEEAIKWYTEDSIVNKLVNNLLRSALFSTQAFYIQPYFKILFKSILQAYENQNLESQKPFKCYRGGKITAVELEKFRNNKDKFVQNLGFLSTTLDFQVAVKFCANVIFQIQVFPQNMKDRKDKERFPLSYGYAQISKYSQFCAEAQILFNPLNCFKIIDVLNGETDGQWIVKLINKTIEMKQVKQKQLGDEESEDRKIEEIVSYISKQASQIKCQGDAFNDNYDLVGFQEYWIVYLKLLENQKGNLSQIRLKKVSALIKMAQYQHYIGSIKKPQQIIGEAYKLIFDTELSVLKVQSQQNQQKVFSMNQQYYNAYTSIIVEAVRIWIKKGLLSKCMRVLEIYLSCNLAMYKNPPQQIVQSLVVLHLRSQYFSKAPTLYKRYIKQKKKDSKKLLIKTMEPILQGNKNTTQDFTKIFSKFLEMQSQIVGFNDFNYINMLFQLQDFILMEKKKLNDKQKQIFLKYQSLLNEENTSNQNSIQYASALLSLSTKIKTYNHSQIIEKAKKILKRIQEKFGKFNYKYLQLNKRIIHHSFALGNLQENEGNLVDVVKMFDKQQEIYNAKYWIYLRSLFLVFHQSDRCQISYRIVKKVLKLQQEAGETQNFQYLRWMYKKVMLLSEQGKFQAAIPIIQTIQAAYNNILGQQSNHNVYLEFLQEIGSLFLQNNCFEKAQDYFYKSLKICESSLVQTHVVRISAQQKIAQLYQYKNKFSKAAQIYERCLIKKEKVFQLHSPQYIQSISQLVQCYWKMGEYKQTLFYIKICINLKSKYSSFKNYYDYDPFNIQMLIYERMNKLRQAVSISETCLKIQIKFLQPRWRPSQIINSLSNLFLLKERKGLIASSCEILEGVMKSPFLKQLSKMDKTTLLQKSNSFQHLYKMITNLRKTVKTYENVIKKLQQLRHSEILSKQIIGFYRKLALAYQEMGRVQKSIQVIEILIQVKFQLYKQKGSSKFLTFLILHKPQLIWKAKIRVILLRQFSQIEKSICQHAFFQRSSHLQIQYRRKKIIHILRLTQLLRRMTKKLQKKYENQTIAELNKLKISLYQKRSKKLFGNLRISKKAIRRSEKMNFLQIF